MPTSLVKKRYFLLIFGERKFCPTLRPSPSPPPSPHLEIPGHATVTLTFTDMRRTFNTSQGQHQSELLCNLIT